MLKFSDTNTRLVALVLELGRGRVRAREPAPDRGDLPDPEVDPREEVENDVPERGVAAIPEVLRGREGGGFSRNF